MAYILLAAFEPIRTVCRGSSLVRATLPNNLAELEDRSKKSYPGGTSEAASLDRSIVAQKIKYLLRLIWVFTACRWPLYLTVPLFCVICDLTNDHGIKADCEEEHPLPLGTYREYQWCPHAVHADLTSDGNGALAVQATLIVVGNGGKDEALLAHPPGIALWRRFKEEHALWREVPLD